MPVDTPVADETVALRPAPFWTPMLAGLTFGVAGGVAGGLLGMIKAGRTPSPMLMLWTAGAMLGVVALVMIFRLRTKPHEAPVIRMGRDSLQLPASIHSRRVREIPYADVLSLDTFGTGKRARLLVSTRKRLFVYPLNRFVDADPVERLRAHVRAALQSLPDAAERIRRMDEREQLGKQAWARKPVITTLLLGIIVIVYLMEQSIGALERTFTLVRYGANAPALVWQGQWFRLFSANFLHLNLMHVYMNALALFSLGLLLEKLTGRWRFALIYLLSAFGGALTSALLAQATFSVGASTAIFGLLGALATLNWKYGGQLPSGFRQPATWWIFIIGLNVAITVLLPAIDVGAHAGGALAGVVVTLLLYRGVEVIRADLSPSVVTRILVLASVAAFGWGLALAAAHARSGPVSDEMLAVERAFASSRATKPAALNEFAWSVYLDQAATPAELSVALEAVNEAIRRKPKQEFFDSQAALLFRTGQVEAAIRSELSALAMGEKDFYWWQLTRFLDRRVRGAGPLTLGAVVDLPLIEPGSTDTSRVVEFRNPCLHGCSVYALTQRDDSTTGVLQILIGADTPNVVRVDLDQIAGVQVPSTARLTLALLNADTCRQCTVQEVRARYVPLDEPIR